MYQAYADYEDLMAITEDLLSSMVKDLTGSFVLKYVRTYACRDAWTSFSECRVVFCIAGMVTWTLISHLHFDG